MDIESEIRELRRRVGALEGAVSVLTGQLGQVHPDLVAHAQSTAERFDTVEGMVSKVATRLDTLNTQLWSLRDDLPDLVAEALRKSGPDAEA